MSTVEEAAARQDEFFRLFVNEAPKGADREREREISRNKRLWAAIRGARDSSITKSEREAFDSRYPEIGSKTTEAVHITDATFDQRLDLSGLKFDSSITFSNCVFSEGIEMHDCYMQSGISFLECTFRGSVILHGAQSIHPVHFEACNVSPKDERCPKHQATFFPLNVSAAKIRGLSIENCDFGTLRLVAKDKTEIRELDLTGTTLDSIVAPELTSFRVAFGEKTTIKNDCNFQQVHFTDRTDFSAARFVTRPPLIVEAKLFQDTRFSTDPRDWPKPTDNAAQADENAQRYSFLKHHFQQVSCHNETSFFSMMETRERHAGKRSLMSLISALYFTTSHYGRSAIRPLLWAVGLTLLFGLTYAGYFAQAGFPYPPDAPPPSHPYLSGLGLGISNSIVFFGLKQVFFEPDFLRSMPFPLQFLMGLQSIISLPLWFLFGLGLRHQFRVG